MPVHVHCYALAGEIAVRGDFSRISYSCAGPFVEHYMIREFYFTCNIVSSCFFW